MDAPLVRLLLTAIAENKPSQIQRGELSMVLAWMKQRKWQSRKDDATKEEFNPTMAAAADAAEKAVIQFENGNIEAAKVFALEALKGFPG